MKKLLMIFAIASIFTMAVVAEDKKETKAKVKNLLSNMSKRDIVIKKKQKQIILLQKELNQNGLIFLTLMFLSLRFWKEKTVMQLFTRRIELAQVQLLFLKHGLKEILIIQEN